MVFKYFIHLFVFLLMSMSYAWAQDTSKAVILQYSRIGEDSFTRTNSSLEQFQDHLRELQSGGYTVLALPDVLNAFKTKKELPENTVVITFDGGYKESLDEILPLLDEADLPYTVFFAPQNADLKASAFLSWQDLKSLSRKENVTLGIHPMSYVRLGGLPESDIRASINSAKASFRENLGTNPQYFAYPFGEYSKTYRDIVEASGFDAALSLNSGAIYEASDLYTLPRFAMSESFGNLERFRLIAHTHPLKIENFEPDDPQLKTLTPTIGFTLVEKDIEPEKLSCFMTGIGKVPIEMIGDRRVELRPASDLDEQRTRVNCTYPIHDPTSAEEPTWKWFGMLLTLPQ